ncbi:hypothetical protein OIV83_005835 [Microbotryomycetes sp. JL201]|nr:hypothetical protein OIV83_005835 [Microbotryomycetes sp. JL201]
MFATPKRSSWTPIILFSGLLLLVLLVSTHPPQSARPAVALAHEKLANYLPALPPMLRPPLYSNSASNQDASLEYRLMLEKTTSPPRQMEHSPTLGFSKIYVLSLPTRQDRRDEMSKLAKALGITVEFVDAANKDESFIQWIGERIAETRKQRRQLMAEAQNKPVDSIGGLGIGSQWLQPTLDGKQPFPQFPRDERYPSGSWTAHLEAYFDAGNHTTLKPENPKFDLREALHDYREKRIVRQLHEGIISTYWGQTRALKQVIRNRDDTALILEDDVDIEWDVERLWSRIAMRLPEEWDVTFLGHCWGHESKRPSYKHPLLHQSVSPMCLHGWSVTQTGAQRIFAHLLDPWKAFMLAVDAAVPTLIKFGQVRAFSVQPPLIIQRKDGPSDLQGGNGSSWKGVLRDSTVDRIRIDEGEDVVAEVWKQDAELIDPATLFREVIHCDDEA